ncbi:SHOCT domain-containing protein [Nakamurella flava]|uniref:SHOCT domain-containing protein n=1 Tax=Nakamurella flava TaxID=2576308 RepID=A0A4U6QJ10_9ACTN|nr:SHOCT domain-containing protein [Nakamurella flava]TKV60410.1 SHOCT domain-containing protein [Nakamurella flava]
MLGRGLGRGGRPGLLGTMARTAVVAGTATAVSGNVARKQQARDVESAQAAAYRQQQTAPPPAPAAAPPPPAPPAPAGPPKDMNVVIQQLQQLGQLRDAGVLTEEEFAAQKAKLLG